MTYIEDIGAPLTGRYNNYIEDNNTAVLFNGNFASLFTAGSVLLSVQSDLGLTSSGGLVSAWADQSGNNNHFTQGSASLKPTITTGLNGFPGVLFDGVDDVLNSPLALPSPGATPTFIWAVWRQITAVAGQSIYCGTSFPSHCLIASTSPAIFQYCGASNNINSAMTLTSWFRTEAYYANSTPNDYLKVGNTTAQTGSAGLVGGSNFQLGNSGNLGGRYGNMEVLCWVVTNTLPTVPQLSALSAAATAKYGVTVGV